MLIPWREVRQAGVRPRVIVHVGAHHGQEAKWYREWGAQRVLWIEANPALIPTLEANIASYRGHRAVQALLGPRAGEKVGFNIAEADNGSNLGQSSSVLPLGDHAIHHPEVSYVDRVELVTDTLDHCATFAGFSACDLLVLDVQGYELHVLRGGETMVDSAQAVYLEVNVDELYRGGALLPEVARWLLARGFECRNVKLAGCQYRDCSDGGNRWVGWGDALFVRADHPRPFRDVFPGLWGSWYPDAV